MGSFDAILVCVAAGMGYALMPQAVMHTQQAALACRAARRSRALADIGVVDTWLVSAQAKPVARVARLGGVAGTRTVALPQQMAEAETLMA